MSGDSHTDAGDHWVLRLATVVSRTLGPLLRRLKKDAFNPPGVPAKAVADLLEQPDNHLGGRYFILDDEAESSAASRDKKFQEEIWGKVCKDLNLSSEI